MQEVGILCPASSLVMLNHLQPGSLVDWFWSGTEEFEAYYLVCILLDVVVNGYVNGKAAATKAKDGGIRKGERGGGCRGK